jgi:hypothetical protein
MSNSAYTFIISIKSRQIFLNYKTIIKKQLKWNEELS